MKRVLVVDNEPLLIGLLVGALEFVGFELVVCESGEEAVFHIGEVDAIITDFLMGLGMNGAGLAREAKHRNPGIPVLIITGTVDQVPRDHLADMIIEKPDILLPVFRWLSKIFPEEEIMFPWKPK